ncbi:hypothetical protein HUU59_05755 [bacterium]|nr:hypothetical protein [bacterium]
MRIVLFFIATLLFSCGQSLPDDPNTPVIVLSRHGCYGRCAVYTVNIFSDGRVVYNLNDRFMGVSRRWENKVTGDEVNNLIDTIVDSGFRDMDESRNRGPIDAAESTIAFNWGDKHKSIRYWHGIKKLESIAKQIDEVAGTKRAHEFLAAEVDKVKQSRMDRKVDPHAEYSNGAIFLDRLECGAGCPSYTISVQTNGMVVFEGKMNVASTGRRIGWISMESAKSLIDVTVASGFMSTEDTLQIADSDSASTSKTRITLVLDQEVLSSYIKPNSPHVIATLDSSIDIIVRTAKWINGD